MNPLGKDLFQIRFHAVVDHVDDGAFDHDPADLPGIQQQPQQVPFGPHAFDLNERGLAGRESRSRRQPAPTATPGGARRPRPFHPDRPPLWPPASASGLRAAIAGKNTIAAVNTPAATSQRCQRQRGSRRTGPGGDSCVASRTGRCVTVAMAQLRPGGKAEGGWLFERGIVVTCAQSLQIGLAACHPFFMGDSLPAEAARNLWASPLAVTGQSAHPAADRPALCRNTSRRAGGLNRRLRSLRGGRCGRRIRRLPRQSESGCPAEPM